MHAPTSAVATALLGALARDAICTDSDANGAYSIGELFAAEYRVVANARGLRPGAAHVRLAAGEQRQTVDVSLPDGGVEVAGVVADIGGGPISRAQLRAGDAVAESNERGEFSLWVAPDDTTHWIEVSILGPQLDDVVVPVDVD